MKTLAGLFALAIAVVLCLARSAHAQPTPSTCPRPPALPVLKKDFTPDKPKAPKPKGNTYRWRPEDITSGSQGLDAWEYAIHMQFFFNGGGREPVLPTDAMIMNDVMVNALRSQDEVQNDIQASKQAAAQSARAIFKDLQCGQSAEIVHRGSRVGVQANESSYGLHLAVGSFSIYWEATCTVGPKECCVDDASCDSGKGHRAPYSCKIAFTLYDNYNFSSKSGTGGTGWLKAVNPAGWFGTSFDQFGYFTIGDQGVVRACVDAAECCKPGSKEPETAGVIPGHGGQADGATTVKPEPPTPVTETTPPCPECVPIAEALANAKKAVLDAKAAVARLEGLAAANRQSQAELKKQLEAFEKDLGPGWTASGVDTETGITKSYDATKGDGMVHVTVTDKSGKVLSKYDYKRSKSKVEAQRRIDQTKALLGALEEDAAKLEKDLTAAKESLAAAEASVKKLQAELEDCLERCRKGTTPTEDKRTSLVPERPFLVQPSFGVLAGIDAQPAGPLVGALLGYRVIPNGYVVFAPELMFGTNNTIIALPVGFQYDIAIPGVPNLFAYPRGALGYAADIFSFSGFGTSFSNTTHLFTFGFAGGAKYVIDNRWILAAEPLGMNVYVGNGAGVAYRAALAVGMSLP